MGEIKKFKVVVVILLPDGQIVFAEPVNGKQPMENKADCPACGLCAQIAGSTGLRSFCCIRDCSGFKNGLAVEYAEMIKRIFEGDKDQIWRRTKFNFLIPPKDVCAMAATG